MSSARVCSPTRVSSRHPGEAVVEALAGIEAVDGAAVELVELVAVDRVVEEIGEVVVELQRGADHIGIDVGLAEVARLRELARQAEPAGDAAVGRIERAEADRSGPGRSRAARPGRSRSSDWRRPSPVSVKPSVARALAVAQHAVELADVVRHVPRAVIGVRLERREQRAVADLGRAGRERRR